MFASCACTADAARAATRNPPAIEKILCVNIGNVPRFVNRPALDRIEVIDRPERPVRSADRNELLQSRLHVTGFVGATALQDRGLAVPHPGEAEANRADGLGRGFE